MDKENSTASNAATANRNRQLMEGPPMLKRPRLSVDGWVRKGVHLKTLIDNAVSRRHYTEPSVAAATGEESLSLAESTTVLQETSESKQEAAAALAREKTSEALLLQRQLKTAQSASATLQATNESLREELQAAQSQLERTRSALSIAGTHAAQARAQADQAQATTQTLQTNLESLQQVVQETKQACRVLEQEQSQVRRQAQTVQATLVQKETQLARIQSQHSQMVTDKKSWLLHKQDLQRQVTQHQERCRTLKTTSDQLQTQLDTQITLQQQRQERYQREQAEWRQSQTLVQQATAAAAQAQETIATLRNDLNTFQTTNTELHQRLEKVQTQHGQEQQETLERLSQAQKQVQEGEFAQQELRDQISRLQAKLEAHQQATSSSNNSQTSTQHQEQTITQQRQQQPAAMPKTPRLSFPSLGGSSSSSSKTVVCIVCQQGILNGQLSKRCQCGNDDCQARAHSHCASQVVAACPSVSHPGTPAPRLALVLCKESLPASAE